MDIQALSTRADAVGEDLKRTIKAIAIETAAAQNEQDVRVGDGLRAAREKMDVAQAARDSQVLTDVATRLTALRDEVKELTDTLDKGHTAEREAGDRKVAATAQRDLADARNAITDQIAEANRATHDAVMAQVRSLLKQ